MMSMKKDKILIVNWLNLVPLLISIIAFTGILYFKSDNLFKDIVNDAFLILGLILLYFFGIITYTISYFNNFFKKLINVWLFGFINSFIWIGVICRIIYILNAPFYIYIIPIIALFYFMLLFILNYKLLNNKEK
jgi:hypothetical protein